MTKKQQQQQQVCTGRVPAMTPASATSAGSLSPVTCSRQGHSLTNDMLQQICHDAAMQQYLAACSDHRVPRNGHEITASTDLDLGMHHHDEYLAPDQPEADQTLDIWHSLTASEITCRSVQGYCQNSNEQDTSYGSGNSSGSAQTALMQPLDTPAAAAAAPPVSGINDVWCNARSGPVQRTAVQGHIAARMFEQQQVGASVRSAPCQAAPAAATSYQQQQWYSPVAAAAAAAARSGEPVTTRSCPFQLQQAAGNAWLPLSSSSGLCIAGGSSQVQQQQQQQSVKLFGPFTVTALQPQPSQPMTTQPMLISLPAIQQQAQPPSQTGVLLPDSAAAAVSSTTTTFLVPAGGSVRLSDLLTPDICANAHLALQQRMNAAYHAGYAEGVEYCQQQFRRRQQRALAAKQQSGIVPAAAAAATVLPKGLKRQRCSSLPDLRSQAVKQKSLNGSLSASPHQAAAAAAADVSEPQAGYRVSSVGDTKAEHQIPSMASFLTVDKQEAAARLKGLTDRELLMLAAQVVNQKMSIT